MSLVRLATAFYALLGLLAWGWAWAFDAPLFGDKPPTPLGIAQGFVVGLVIVALCHLMHRMSSHAREASRVMAEFFGPIGVGTAIWLALISGFAEEIAFRGALWPQLELVGTSLFFAILHVIPHRKLALYPVFAFFAGLALGLLRQETGSVWPAVAAHVTVNALNLTWLGATQRKGERMGTPPPAPEPPPPPPAEPRLYSPSDVDLESYPMTVWRYDLRVEPTGTDRQTLPDCLLHENLALFRHVPRDTVCRELAEGRFFFAASFLEPLPGFAADVAAISAYLFEPVLGIEVAERYSDEETTDDVRAWKVVALRGDWVKVPLLVDDREHGRFGIDPDHEDTEVVAAHWHQYPRWFQDGMRFKYPRLREL